MKNHTAIAATLACIAALLVPLAPCAAVDLAVTISDDIAADVIDAAAAAWNYPGRRIDPSESKTAFVQRMLAEHLRDAVRQARRAQELQKYQAAVEAAERALPKGAIRAK